MPTGEEVKLFIDRMDSDMAKAHEMIAAEDMLIKAVARYEKAWGVKINVTLVEEK